MHGTQKLTIQLNLAHVARN